MNQHYVPRVYLKNFAEKKGNEYYVELFDKTNSKHFKTNIKNICAETDLYTLEEDSQVARHKLAIEKVYSDYLEPMYFKTYEILTNDNIVQITNLQRAEIILAIFQLYFRNPIVFRKSLDFHLVKVLEIYNTAIKNNQKGLTYLDVDFSFREWDIDKIQKFIIDKQYKLFKEKHLIGTAQIGLFHEFTIIEVLKISDNSADFLTNDNPIYFEDIISEMENPFLKSNEFFLTLNSKHMVTLYHDNTKKANYIYRTPTLSGNVGMINDIVYQNASRFVIGNKKTFEDLKKFSDFLYDTSLQPKINVIEQILSSPQLRSQSKEGTEILESYYKKFIKNKTLSKQDEYEMIQKFKELNRNDKNQKIKDR